ncbi:MAG: PEP-utilizing enzyme, partial [Alphaproteobacteria bacterium]|nr:PEP-utilizing enzyme [Alphaproteobacteria bacterium]
ADVVQAMIDCEVSGVAFSVNPTDKSNTILIESGKGLGEAVVSGKITPDNYVVDKSTLSIESKNISIQKSILTRSGWLDIIDDSQKLSDAQIEKLAAEVLRIEKFYGFPVDIEWGYVGDELYILQSRPITSFSLEGKSKFPDISGYELTFKVGGLPFMFADLLCRGFGYLKPLFVIDNGEFLQYMPNDMMKWAEEYGYKTFGTPMGFAKHEADFTGFHNKSFPRLQAILASDLTKEDVSEFFDIIYQYFIFYSKTDYQFTNKLYLYADSNPAIAESMKDISRFKDIARVWINETTINDDCLLGQLLSKLSERFGATDIWNYKIDEILALFDGQKVEDTSDRGVSAFARFDEGKYHYAFGAEAKDYAAQIHLHNSIGANSPVQGQVANHGGTRFVEGVARLIKVDYSDLVAVGKAIEEMKKGEILVAEFTAPELMQACEKARAIVTDMGGMLSHAAIVSRELGIPCIVGTGHASKAIKTGDNVILDMDTGKIIKKD